MGVDFFAEFVGQATRFINGAALMVDGMNSRSAFVVGLVTWFLVEQAIRRLAGGLRIAILATAVAGSGVAVGSVVMHALA